MEVLKQHWLGLLLCLVAVAIFSSALQFRKYRIMMAGEPRRVVLRVAPFVEGEATRLLASVRAWVERGAT